MDISWSPLTAFVIMIVIVSDIVAQRAAAQFSSRTARGRRSRNPSDTRSASSTGIRTTPTQTGTRRIGKRSSETRTGTARGFGSSSVGTESSSRGSPGSSGGIGSFESSSGGARGSSGGRFSGTGSTFEGSSDGTSDNFGGSSGGTNGRIGSGSSGTRDGFGDSPDDSFAGNSGGGLGSSISRGNLEGSYGGTGGSANSMGNTGRIGNSGFGIGTTDTGNFGGGLGDTGTGGASGAFGSTGNLGVSGIWSSRGSSASDGTWDSRGRDSSHRNTLFSSTRLTSSTRRSRVMGNFRSTGSGYYRGRITAGSTYSRVIRTRIATRHTRAYSAGRIGRYYQYYALYHSRAGLYSHRVYNNDDVRLCENYEADVNGTAIGWFECPFPFEPSSYTVCCGDRYAEFCCQPEYESSRYYSSDSSYKDKGKGNKKGKGGITAAIVISIAFFAIITGTGFWIFHKRHFNDNAFFGSGAMAANTSMGFADLHSEKAFQYDAAAFRKDSLLSSFDAKCSGLPTVSSLCNVPPSNGVSFTHPLQDSSEA